MVNEGQCYFNTEYWKSRQDIRTAWTKVAVVREMGRLKN